MTNIENLKGKRLLVLGGDNWISAIKDFCSNHYVTLIASGNNKNSKLFEIADESYFIDNLDAAEMKKLINDKKIDGVYMGANERVISSACRYINEIGKPCYCTFDQWKIIQNKIEFKKMCERFELPVAKKYDFVPGQRCGIDFPVVTKPADGCGSKGFSINKNYSDLDTGFKLAKENSNSGEVIVEKYVNNTGHVVFYSFSNGEGHFCLLQDKYPFRFDNNSSYVAGAHLYQSAFTNEFVNLFDYKIKRMFNSIGIKEGTVWIEVFHDGGNYYFNEAGFRYGGSISIYPVDYFCNINQVASDIYYSLTGKSALFGFETMIPSNVCHNKTHYCMYPIYCYPGIIKNMRVSSLLEKNDNVVAIITKKNVGDIVPNSGDFSQNVMYIHFVFDNKKEFFDIISLIEESVAITDDENKDMIIYHDNDFFDGIRF